MAIGIKGYDPIFRNQVFVNPKTNRKVYGLKAAALARLTRFDMPSEEEVMYLIQKSAEEVVKNPNEASGNIHGEIKAMESPELERMIAASDPETMRELSRFYVPEHEGSYLHFMKGDIAQVFVKVIPEALSRKGAGFYYKLMGNIGQSIWGLEILLGGGSELPRQYEIEDSAEKIFAEQRGMVRPYELKATAGNLSLYGDFRNYDDVRNHIGILYRSLEDANLLELESSSDETKSDKAVQTVADFSAHNKRGGNWNLTRRLN